MTVRWGMSAPDDQWDARSAEVGSGLRSRRRFNPPGQWNIAPKAKECLDAGLFPVVSIKPCMPGEPWVNVLNGSKDAQIDTLARTLASLDAPMAFCAHHEPGPGENGTLSEWARMGPYFRARIKPIAPKVRVGLIDNGFHFDKDSYGFTDAELDAYYTPTMLAGIDFLAADCYQGGTTDNPLRDASYKVKAMTRFADRRGFTKPMGIGEYNGITADAITAAQDAIRADRRFKWANIFNSNSNNRDGVAWVLTGDRLDAFKSVL